MSEKEKQKEPTELHEKSWLDYTPDEWVNFLKTIGTEIVAPLKERARVYVKKKKG